MVGTVTGTHVTPLADSTIVPLSPTAMARAPLLDTAFKFCVVLEAAVVHTVMSVL